MIKQLAIKKLILLNYRVFLSVEGEEVIIIMLNGKKLLCKIVKVYHSRGAYIRLTERVNGTDISCINDCDAVIAYELPSGRCWIIPVDRITIGVANLRIEKEYDDCRVYEQPIVLEVEEGQTEELKENLDDISKLLKGFSDGN